MFTLVPIFIGIVFCIVIGSIIFRTASGVAEWHNNNQQPRLSKEVRVISRREEAHQRSRHHGHGVHHHHHSTYYRYYVTFEEVDRGERLQFQVGNREYDTIVEGDQGTLRHQGTRFLGFERSASGAAAALHTGPDYECDHCGAAIGEGAEVSPHGDIMCSYCNKWFNIHSPA
jgi:hypothetical protein